MAKRSNRSQTTSDRQSALRAAIWQTIQSIPRGKVATYGQVAAAAGYPRFHRQVAQLLSQYGAGLPWHRVLGAGGEIKTGLAAKLEQRMLLEMEGVGFRGRRVDMQQHQHLFESLSGRRKSPRPRT